MAQIPSDLQQYKFVLSLSPHHITYTCGRSSSSYEIDPQWARRFTIAWTSVAAAGIVASLPRLYKSVKQGRAFTGIFGVTESWKATPYVLAEERRLRERGTPWKLGTNIKRVWAVFSWTFPGSDISVGQSEYNFSSHFRRLSNNPLQCCWWQGTSPHW